MQTCEMSDMDVPWVKVERGKDSERDSPRGARIAAKALISWRAKVGGMRNGNVLYNSFLAPLLYVVRERGVGGVAIPFVGVSRGAELTVVGGQHLLPKSSTRVVPRPKEYYCATNSLFSVSCGI